MEDLGEKSESLTVTACRVYWRIGELRSGGRVCATRRHPVETESPIEDERRENLERDQIPDSLQLFGPVPGMPWEGAVMKVFGQLP